ncbi:zinc finger protein-domain-containing protein [Sordaria brevicollis]|uniref:Zinc finger protein-domain-containing protein n=1 Tax=Sordaria brevicollis TaxID=83679 RepID=A0AAE0U948_SORBR|nr:zinc finger protein-domain-containing protein [Sordaria brevicollis]
MPVQLRPSFLPPLSTPRVSSEMDEVLKASELDKNLHQAISLNSSLPSYTSAEEGIPVLSADPSSYRKIGAGACGAIFAQEGNKSVVVKLAKGPVGDNELWNDFRQHCKIFHTFKKVYHIDEVQIPTPLGFIKPDVDEFWAENPGLTAAAEPLIRILPTDALLSERILPLPPITQHLLIDKYCNPRGKSKALADPANGDCLVRVYLGSMAGTSGGMFFSLRNLKLHLNQLLELGIDIEELARRMGLALAVMHWGAKTDARDVEFVLGNSSEKQAQLEFGPDIWDGPERSTRPPGGHYRLEEDFYRRVTQMWVLDFNQVRDITLDEAGVALAVEAVKLNDPYYPKPLKETEAERIVWRAFVGSYLENATTILEAALKDNKSLGNPEDILALPRKFILGITELERERMSRRDSGGIAGLDGRVIK